MIKDKKGLLEKIRNVIDGKTTKQRIAIIYGVSVRSVERYIKDYKENGEEHFLKEHIRKNVINSVSDRVTEIYLSECYDFNFKHFRNILEKEYDINISSEYVRKILTKKGILSPLCWKRTIREYSKKLEREEKILETGLIEHLDTFHYNYDKYHHSRKPRSKYFGECIQFDATSFEWCSDKRFTLHLAIDDSTSRIVGAFFDYEETLFGYYNVLKQLLTEDGIPFNILTDNRNIFNYNSSIKNLERHKLTQFEEKCKELGISLETSSIPQKKGRVERAHGSIKRRLPQELRFYGIEDMESANEYLKKFIESYNNLFSLATTSVQSVFEALPESFNLNLFLSVSDYRTIDNGGCIIVDKEYYILTDKDGTYANLRPKSRGIIYKCLDGELIFQFNKEYYYLKKLPMRYDFSKNIDVE